MSPVLVHIRLLMQREEAAVTSDFVVLTAGVLMLALSVGGTIPESVLNLLDTITAALADHGF